MGGTSATHVVAPFVERNGFCFMMKFNAKFPKIKETGNKGFNEDDGDEMGEEFEGNADVADMHKDAQLSDDDIDDELEFGNPGAAMTTKDQDDLL